MAFGEIQGTAHSITVFDFIRIKIEDDHGEDMADTERCWKGYFSEGFVFPEVEQD